MNKAIKRFVNSKNIGVVDFAKKAGVHKSVISTLINDKRDFKKMTVENAYKISKVMNCSINSIYEEEGKQGDI